MNLKLVRTDNFFFSFQKIPFKWLEISISHYKFQNTNLLELGLVIQITKFRFHFEYKSK